MASLPNTLGVILSGGAGKRLGGIDKGLHVYRGKPLVQWVVNALRPQVNDILICINRNKAEYENFTSSVVSDFGSGENYQGPIAGIVSAINYCTAGKKPLLFDQLLISSCDTPLLPNNYLQKLNDALLASNQSVAVVNDGERNQNLHCLIKKEAYRALADFYAGGGRAMHRWYKKIGVLEVDFSKQADCFLNINSADHLN